MLPAEGERVVLVTAPDEERAAALAGGLVEAGLAACVSRVPGLRSTYVWKGSVEEDEEVLLVIKTRLDRLEELARYLGEHHPYEPPECISLAPAEVERAYLAWWRAGVSEG